MRNVYSKVSWKKKEGEIPQLKQKSHLIHLCPPRSYLKQCPSKSCAYKSMDDGRKRGTYKAYYIYQGEPFIIKYFSKLFLSD